MGVVAVKNVVSPPQLIPAVAPAVLAKLAELPPAITTLAVMMT